MSLTEEIYKNLISNQKKDEIINKEKEDELDIEKALESICDDHIYEAYNNDTNKAFNIYWIQKLLKELTENISNGNVDIDDVKINISYKKYGVKKSIKFKGLNRKIFRRSK